MFDMINIFEVFLPQLLRYPNPTDPLNGEAAALLMRDPKTYETKVKGRLFWNYFCEMGKLTLGTQITYQSTLPKTPQTRLAKMRIRRVR